MQVKAIEIASLLGGIVEGDAEVLVHKPAKIEEGEAGAISFFANPKYEDYVYRCKSSILLVSKDFKPREELPMTLIRVDDVYASLSVLMEHFGNLMEEDKDENEWISADAYIHPSAQIAEGVKVEALAYIGANAVIAEGTHIYPQVYIGADVKIGANSILYPGSRVYKGCKIGVGCILQSNAVIGSDGFGFAPQEDGSFKKIPQLGIVELGDGVEVGANTVIDRATMGATVIENGVKLDNLIQIAHNVRIGANTVIAAQAGIAGSTKLGENCMIGGQVGLVGHIEIANGTKIQAQSGINKSIKQENSAWFGAPAQPYKDFLRSHAVFKQLPQLLKRLDELEKELKAKDQA
jgi:UDP-3-O-[3-hydroxymyristoyl] glucosamine N-acyltransferase